MLLLHKFETKMSFHQQQISQQVFEFSLVESRKNWKKLSGAFSVLAEFEGPLQISLKNINKVKI